MAKTKHLTLCILLLSKWVLERIRRSWWCPMTVCTDGNFNRYLLFTIWIVLIEMFWNIFTSSLSGFILDVSFYFLKRVVAKPPTDHRWRRSVVMLLFARVFNIFNLFQLLRKEWQKKGCHHLIMICWKFWLGNQFRFSPHHIENDEECNYKRGSHGRILLHLHKTF